MQAGEAGFADGVQARHIGVAMFVDHHAAAGVMRRRYYRDGLLSDVDTKCQAALIYSREVGLDKAIGLMADIQVHTIDAQTLHFMVDGPGDDIPRGQFAPRVEAMHETLAVGQLEVRAFAPQGFSD